MGDPYWNTTPRWSDDLRVYVRRYLSFEGLPVAQICHIKKRRLNFCSFNWRFFSTAATLGSMFTSATDLVAQFLSTARRVGLVTWRAWLANGGAGGACRGNIDLHAEAKQETLFRGSRRPSPINQVATVARKDHMSRPQNCSKNSTPQCAASFCFILSPFFCDHTLYRFENHILKIKRINTFTQMIHKTQCSPTYTAPPSYHLTHTPANHMHA